MITVEGLHHAYHGKCVLSLARWHVARGEACLVLGPSGAGKTTLLHVLAGVLTPAAGRVVVSGQDLSELRRAERDRFRGRHIGIVPQRFHLVGSLSVLRNLLLAQYLAGLKEDPGRALAILGELGIADKARHHPRELSHGQAQRVALARAVINRPQVILADEPTSNLDDARCAEAFELLVQQAAACNAALVIATHDARIRDKVAHELRLEAAA